MKKKICAIIALSCAIGILGALGSMEIDRMSISEAFRISIVLLPVAIASVKIGGLLK